MAVHGEDVEEDEKGDGHHVEKRRQAVGEGVKQARADADRRQRRDKRHAQRRPRCVEAQGADDRRNEEGEVRQGVQRLSPETRAQRSQ
jgi:hypothetical protein